MPGVPPHAQMAVTCLEALVRHRSFVEAARALKGRYFPLFPPELEYMSRRSGLHYCVESPSGYRITPNVIRTLATDLRMIGVWTWSDTDPLPNNHLPAVPEDLWLQACEIASGKPKPRGKAARFEPLDWAGLLYCTHHPEPLRLSGHASRGRYRCHRDHELGQGDLCLDLSARFLDEPLGREVLRQLRLDDYAEEVLARLETEASAGKLEESQRRQEETKVVRELQGLRGLLGTLAAADQRQARICLEQIEASEEKLVELRARPLPTKAVTSVDVAWVRRFLGELSQRWASCPGAARNRLLEALVERVLVHQEDRTVEATIVWRGGHREQLRIHLPPARHTKEGQWTEEEDRLVRLLWPGSSRGAVLAALPERTWKAITDYARRQGLRRQRMREAPVSPFRQWTSEEEKTLQALYEAGAAVEAIAQTLGRSIHAVEVRASHLKLERPKPKQTQVYWQVPHNRDVSDAEPTGIRIARSDSLNGSGGLRHVVWPIPSVPRHLEKRRARNRCHTLGRAPCCPTVCPAC